jgi:hypothetical protein
MASQWRGSLVSESEAIQAAKSKFDRFVAIACRASVDKPLLAPSKAHWIGKYPTEAA